MENNLESDCEKDIKALLLGDYLTNDILKEVEWTPRFSLVDIDFLRDPANFGECV